MNPLVDAARRWAERGFVPLAAAGKAPLVRGWQTLDPNEHLARIEADPPPQIGLRMGTQRDERTLIAIDVDGPTGERSLEQLTGEFGALPPTLTQRTGGGGRHLVFEWPEARAGACPTISAGKLAYAIDIRGKCGHIVAAPSTHESGRLYQLIDERAPALLPEAWVRRIVESHPSPRRPESAAGQPRSRIDPVEALKRCRRYVARMEPAISGAGGHHATWRAAQAIVRGFGLVGTDALAILREYNARCQPPWTERDLAHKLEDVAGSGVPCGYLLEGAAWQPVPYGSPTASPREGGSSSQSTDASNRGPRPEERTDLGNARRLVRLHGHDLKYFAARRCWLVWDGQRWIQDRTGEITRRAKDAVESMFAAAAKLPEEQRADARKWALASQNAKRITAMIALAESEPDMPVLAVDLDSDPWILNTRSGVLDLRTDELHQPDPIRLVTKICRAPYVPGARSDLWDRFVEDLFGDDLGLREYVQRAIGYSLFGAWREKRFWFGWGPPDGGKSTFLGTIGDVLGDYHAAADASTWMLQSNNGGNRGDLTRLLGARLVTTLEVRPNARFDQQLMKKATGGDILVAAAKYEAEIEFAPTFALWFGANDRPTIPDDDEGLWKRVACVPFTRVVPAMRQDKELRAKLASVEHAPAVLAWLVEGCLRWQRQGIGTCAAVDAAVDAYRRDSNQAAGFFDECLRLAPGVHALCSEVSAAYHQWASDNGVRHPLNSRKLGQRLRQLGATGGDDASRVRGVRVWRGVELVGGSGGWK